jgi:nitrile hydratase
MTEEHHYATPTTAIEDRVNALEALMIEKGLLDLDAMQGVLDYVENQIGPMNGAKVVAHAWVDRGYRERLLADGTAAIAELGYGAFQSNPMVVVENTPDVHNVVVCTLCSCYPFAVLGMAPSWYKSAPYRARVVREPRVVLAEVGSPIPDDVEVRVWDSSAEVRYLVLPMRPDGTEGLSEEALAGLVTRDGMIGVARV